eukprot:7265492-Ditylum_brightwellii.AAC.1
MYNVVSINGYIVFVSRYFGDCKLLSEEDKGSHLIASGVWAAPVFSMSDEDRSRTVSSYKAYHIMMAAARHWH